ncbi:hypothetical protein LPB86_05775 [Pedobacter sp. MC2016-14]|uniref:hypothetical protein n=1 Tax=Pedobacter sp. MC2016-14 TaxID=2897327 RepID=UPI001E644E7A|nr:hypothetical protein [Pedobacter sp. MC2016-14]MCD0487727.1 hypothetical protein [Pedobacter sp. MC2016-14]
MAAEPLACTFGHMLLRSFQFTVFLALLINVCLAQDELPAKETTSNKIYFEFKPVSGVIIKAGAKDTAFYDLDEALGFHQNMLRFIVA